LVSKEQPKRNQTGAFVEPRAAYMDVSAVVDEQLDNGRVALLRRDVEGRGAVELGAVDQRALGNQEARQLNTAVLRRDEQRRRPCRPLRRDDWWPW
jgi:hypothetical protein